MQWALASDNRTAKLSPEGVAFFLLSQRQRRFISRQQPAPKRCWLLAETGIIGVCRQGEARVGPAGG